jgi:hypothetical protein
MFINVLRFKGDNFVKKRPRVAVTVIMGTTVLFN